MGLSVEKLALVAGVLRPCLSLLLALVLAEEGALLSLAALALLVSLCQLLPEIGPTLIV
jgi:hypothetical protein